MSVFICGDKFAIGSTGSLYVDGVLKRYCEKDPSLILKCWAYLQLRKKVEKREIPEDVIANLKIDCPDDLMRALEYLLQKRSEER